MLKRILTSLAYDLILIILGIIIAFASFKAKTLESTNYNYIFTLVVFTITWIIFFVLAFTSFMIYNKNVPIKMIDKIVELVLVGFVMLFMSICSTMYLVLGKFPYLGKIIVTYGQYLPQSYYLLGLAECIARITRKVKAK